MFYGVRDWGADFSFGCFLGGGFFRGCFGVVIKIPCRRGFGEPGSKFDGEILMSVLNALGDAGYGWG